MRIPRVYISQSLYENTSVQLDVSSSHHLLNVLRMQRGRKLILFNGQGGEYEASIESISNKLVKVRVGTFQNVNPESKLDIELGICLIKNDPMVWLLQKSTELGASAFVPLISQYTDVKFPKERVSRKLQHWRQVIQSACQQSGRTKLPSISEPRKFVEWLAVKADEKYIFHPYRSQEFRPKTQAKRIALLVGPEGGLSELELELAEHNRFIPVSLGPRILRAETAPLCALSILQHQLNKR